ncbi:serine hydrolase domain-containing protein [Kribbella catacumbae]|uniref:serine hydrolase domain-containing protein n=1 Tax=Kribbella catacumbae TaxID=460086 RepID=UPI001ED99455|nr:serine hydrolase [Kribbella catacumbae]
MSSLPRSTPEAQDLSAAALDAFVAALDASEQEIHTLMLVRHGQVVLEEEWAPYRIQDPHLLFSISKSLTSMAIGLLIEDGKLSLDDKVVAFFGDDDLPDKLGDNLAAMEVRHLLTMTTGHAKDTVEALGRDRRAIRIFLGLEVEHEPGTEFVYNTGATYMLSAILQRITGETLLDYLRPRLFEPLGADEATWPLSKEGVTVGGWGLSISTESLAKFSKLLLQRGEWDGKQLVPAAWIDEATKKQVPNDSEDNLDWKQGYGFQFWRGRHNSYRGDGAFGQFCLVFPDHDATLVVTSATPDMQAVLEVVWEHLLPALQGESGSGTPRPPKLELLPLTGPGPRGNGRTYEFEPNHTGITAIKLAEDGVVTLTMVAGAEAEYLGATAGATMDIVCTPGDWHELADVLQDPPQRLATSAYGDGDTIVATIRYLETPFVVTLRCRPEGDGLTVDIVFNVSFGPLRSTLTSK